MEPGSSKAVAPVPVRLGFKAFGARSVRFLKSGSRDTLVTLHYSPSEGHLLKRFRKFRVSGEQHPNPANCKMPAPEAPRRLNPKVVLPGRPELRPQSQCNSFEAQRCPWVIDKQCNSANTSTPKHQGPYGFSQQVGDIVD